VTHSFTENYLGDAGDFLLVNRFARRTPWLHGILAEYAGAGLALFVVLIAVGWWLARRQSSLDRMAAVIWSGIGTLVAVAVNQPIVHAVAERRPYTSIPNALLLVGRSADYGFPSDHATMAGAVATGLLYVNRRLGVLTWCVAVLMAFSRVYVGAHYPHDVAAGLALGATVIVLGRIVVHPLLRTLLHRLARTRLRPALISTAPAQARV